MCVSGDTELGGCDRLGEQDRPVVVQRCFKITRLRNKLGPFLKGFHDTAVVWAIMEYYDSTWYFIS